MVAFVPVETKDFAKNEDQDHADKDPRLLHVCPHSLHYDQSSYTFE